MGAFEDPYNSDPQQEEAGSESDQDSGLQSLELLRPPFWSVGLLALISIAAVFVVDLIVSMIKNPGVLEGGESASPSPLIALILWLVLVGTTVGARLYIRSKPLPPIVFHGDYVEIPPNLRASRSRRVPYTEFLSIYLGGASPHMRLFLESSAHLYQFAQESFVDPEGPQRMFEELRRRILQKPEGMAMLRAMGQRQMIAGKALSHRPFVTHALLGILLVFFANTKFLGALEDPGGLLRWGANSVFLVEQGEYFRLISANFLHGNFPHLLINSIALLSLGGVIERLLGWHRYLMIYLLSGLAATMAFRACGLPIVGGSLGGDLRFVGRLGRAQLARPQGAPAGISTIAPLVAGDSGHQCADTSAGSFHRRGRAFGRFCRRGPVDSAPNL